MDCYAKVKFFTATTIALTAEFNHVFNAFENITFKIFGSPNKFKNTG